jgi:hypothetical protein
MLLSREINTWIFFHVTWIQRGNQTRSKIHHKLLIELAIWSRFFFTATSLDLPPILAHSPCGYRHSRELEAVPSSSRLRRQTASSYQRPTSRRRGSDAGTWKRRGGPSAASRAAPKAVRRSVRIFLAAFVVALERRREDGAASAAIL